MRLFGFEIRRAAREMPTEQKGLSFIRASDGDNYIGNRNLPYLGFNDTAVNRNSIVESAVAWAGRNINQASIVSESLTGGQWEVIDPHPVTTLILNPQALIPPDQRSQLNYSRMLAAIVRSLMLYGNAYLLKLRNSRGQVVGLEWLPSQMVSVSAMPNNAFVVDKYEVQRREGVQKYAPSDVLHFMGQVDDERPTMGRNPLLSVMRMVMTDNEVAQYTHAIMRAPSPGLAVGVQGPGDPPFPIDEKALIEFGKRLEAKSSGEKAGGAIVHNGTISMERLRYSPDEMAIEIISRLPETRICSLLGIPPVVLQLQVGLEQSTYSNMKEAREAATEEFLVPMWNQMASVFQYGLMPEMGAPDQRVRFDTSMVRSLMEDEDAKHRRVREDFAANLLNRAEARQRLGLEAQPGDEKVMAYMLRPVSAPPMPQGQEAAKRTRQAVEGV